MRQSKLARLVLFAAVLLLSSSATTGAWAGSGGVTFVAHEPHVNDVDTSWEKMVMHMKTVVSSKGKTVHTDSMGTTKEKRFTTTTVAVKNGAASAVRVHVIQHTNTDMTNGKIGAPQASPVTGKTYLVKLVNGKAVVTGPHGASVPMVQAAIIGDEVHHLGKPDPLSKFLTSHTFHRGVAVRVPDAVVKDLFHMGPHDRLGPGGMQLVLKKVRRKKGHRLAVFSTQFMISGPTGNGANIATHLKGTLVADTNGGRVVSAKLGGAVEMKGTLHRGPAVFDLEAKGALKVTGTDDYR